MDISVNYRELALVPIFPEELWELIIHKLIKPDDVQCLLNSIPNLRQNFSRIKIQKYFGKVLSATLEQRIFMKKDVLNLRLVCKHWRDQIDHILEAVEPAQHPNVQASAMSEVNPKIDFEEVEVLRPVICLSRAAKIRSLNKAISKHPRNPFVGRAVSFSMGHDSMHQDIEQSEYQRFALEFVRASYTFLRKFGHEIRFAVLDFGSLYAGDDPMIAVRTYRKVIQCIGFLKNAHSIKIGFELPENPVYLSWFNGFLKEEQLAQKLTGLKSFSVLGFSNVVSSDYQCLLKYIFGNLKLTSIGLPLKLWRPEYTELLTNIKEIVIDAEWASNYRKLPIMLTQLECKQLGKVRFFPSRSRNQQLDILDLLRQMKSLRIKTLEICNHQSCMNLFAPRINATKLLPISSIECLSIYDTPKINYDFLYLLPNLKNLKLYGNKLQEKNLVSIGEVCNELTEVIRHYVYAITVNNGKLVWKLLKNLQILTIICTNGQVKQFACK